ncbi:MAG: hypothetical protein ACOY5B_18785 [Spirochaetota bacterium]
MKKSLRKPENWQDFESLCKKLWGEIWKATDIKKNGRSGQAQHGVDISGIPSGATDFSGIQCKGKDDYSNAILSTSEIDQEIEKAKSFKPPLKKLIFATTANKDARLEEYVREKNILHLNNNLFAVELYCWEDIVDLIEENRQTYNWYQEIAKFKGSHEIQIEFNGSKDQVILRPKFIEYRMKTVKARNQRELVDAVTKTIPMQDDLKLPFIDESTRWHDSTICPVRLQFSNIGGGALENIKIELEHAVDGLSFKKSDMSDGIGTSFLDQASPMVTIDSARIRYVNNLYPLIQKDSRSIDFFIKCPPIIFETALTWRFLSKDYDTNGTVLLKIDPHIKIVDNEVFQHPKSDEPEGDIRSYFRPASQKDKSRFNNEFGDSPLLRFARHDQL